MVQYGQDHLVPDKFRGGLVVLPWDLESRHRLKHKRPQAAPSWHLLYKEGVTYTDKPGYACLCTR